MAVDAKRGDSMLARIDLSPEEWAEIRKLAIDHGVSTPKFIGNALRQLLSPKEQAA